MAQQRLVQFRDDELKGMLVEFCKTTNRDEPETARAIVRMFFADGFGVASERLNRNLWAVSDRDLEELYRYGRELVRRSRRSAR